MVSILTSTNDLYNVINRPESPDKVITSERSKVMKEVHNLLFLNLFTSSKKYNFDRFVRGHLEYQLYSQNEKRAFVHLYTKKHQVYDGTVYFIISYNELIEFRDRLQRIKDTVEQSLIRRKKINEKKYSKLFIKNYYHGNHSKSDTMNVKLKWKKVKRF